MYTKKTGNRHEIKCVQISTNSEHALNVFCIDEALKGQYIYMLLLFSDMYMRHASCDNKIKDGGNFDEFVWVIDDH